MQKVNLPIGTSDFEKIRKTGCYYVDKTGLIGEVLKTSGVQVMLIIRPRRFGKTLGMDMLANFFDIRKDSKALFEGLEVSKDPALCEQWRNQWPTLFLSFKDVDGLSFDNAFALLKATFSQFCDAHPELENSERVTERQKEIFLRLREDRASFSDVQGALSVLIHMMRAHYGKPVVLLLDEYDVPLAKASANGYYKEMLEIIKTMMSTALKDNPAL